MDEEEKYDRTRVIHAEIDKNIVGELERSIVGETI